MAGYDKTNTFTLSRNERKEKDTHPDFSGTLNVDGVEYWLSAWTKESRDGRKFFSGSIKPKDAAKSSAPSARNAVTSTGGYDEEVPF